MFERKKPKDTQQPATKYKTVTVKYDSQEFDRRVSEEILNGWELVGGVSIAQLDGEAIFSQALKPIK